MSMYLPRCVSINTDRNIAVSSVSIQICLLMVVKCGPINHGHQSIDTGIMTSGVLISLNTSGKTTTEQFQEKIIGLNNFI